MSRRHRNRGNRGGGGGGASYSATDKHVQHFSASNETFTQYSRDRRDEELARQQVNIEQARRPKKLVEGIVYLLSGGGRRDEKRHEMEGELKRLDLQCQAFNQAIGAILRTEREKTIQFQTLCRAFPHMRPEAQVIAVQIMEKLAATRQVFPSPEVPKLEYRGKT